MARIEYNKLVRDEIQEKITAKGEACEVRIIDSDREFQHALRVKLTEEAEELSRADSRERFLQEYADLMVVLDALTSLMEFTEADIKTAIEENVAKKGFYKKRHLLVWADEEK